MVKEYRGKKKNHPKHPVVSFPLLQSITVHSIVYTAKASKKTTVPK